MVLIVQHYNKFSTQYETSSDCDNIVQIALWLSVLPGRRSTEISEPAQKEKSFKLAVQ